MKIYSERLHMQIIYFLKVSLRKMFMKPYTLDINMCFRGHPNSQQPKICNLWNLQDRSSNHKDTQ